MEQENQATVDGSAAEAVVELQVAFPDHGSVVRGSDGVEVIVHDHDENGNVIGWHKELQEGQ